MNETIEILKNIREIHGQNQDCNQDPYMMGLYNGLELALSIAEGRQPMYKEWVPPVIQ